MGGDASGADGDEWANDSFICLLKQVFCKARGLFFANSPAFIALYYLTKDCLGACVRLGEFFVGRALLVVPAVFGDSADTLYDKVQLIDNSIFYVRVERLDLFAPREKSAADDLVGRLDYK